MISIPIESIYILAPSRLVYFPSFSFGARVPFDWSTSRVMCSTTTIINSLQLWLSIGTHQNKFQWLLEDRDSVIADRGIVLRQINSFFASSSSSDHFRTRPRNLRLKISRSPFMNLFRTNWNTFFLLAFNCIADFHRAAVLSTLGRAGARAKSKFLDQ